MARVHSLLSPFWREKMKIFAFLLTVSATAESISRLHRKSREFYPGTEEDKRKFCLLMRDKNLIDDRNHNITHQREQSSYEMKLNSFSDLAEDRWKPDARHFYSSLNSVYGKQSEDMESFEDEDSPLPREVNWLEKKAVSTVKNQYYCNASYAFAALAALEGRFFIKYRRLHNLSPQNVIDCSWNQGNKGCLGGAIGDTYKYIVFNEGINTIAEYPFLGFPQDCRYRPDKIAAKMEGYKIVHGEDGLKAAVAEGPVAVIIDARLSTFKKYSHGVYKDDHCGSKGVNHAVAVVGYGTEPISGENYWLVKNSWGPGWGLNGYMKLLRGYRMCGIGLISFVPVV